MSDHIYKIVELTGSSRTSLQEAIENAVARAAKTLHNLRWFEVVETRGHLEAGRIAHWQVTVKIGFTLDEEVEYEDDSDYYRHQASAESSSAKRSTKKAGTRRKSKG